MRSFPDAVRGLLLDVDGTLLEDGRAVEGAAEALEAARAAGLGVRLLTNTSRRPRSAVVTALREAGLETRAEEVLTAPLAAAGWLADEGLRRVALLAPSATREDFAGFDLLGYAGGGAASAERGEFPEGAERPDAVVVGDLGEAWSYDLLDAAFRWVLDGSELVAIQRNRYWRAGGTLHLDAGPFVAALEYAAGRPAVLAGKPSELFFRTAARSLGLQPGEVAMIGDDLEADVVGARVAGALGILVRTGKFREEDLLRTGEEPDLVLDSVADLAGRLRP